VLSAWSTSLISGATAAAATAALPAIQLILSTMPQPMPLWFIASTLMVVALIAGGAVAISVRCGLRLARCSHLGARSVFGIVVISHAILGLLLTMPMESHAIMLDIDSGKTLSNRIPLTVWLTGLTPLLFPGIVSYVIGMASGAAQVPANKALERTREK
jgi:hypothetical protein